METAKEATWTLQTKGKIFGLEKLERRENYLL
jgi:hypothetical protein